MEFKELVFDALFTAVIVMLLCACFGCSSIYKGKREHFFWDLRDMNAVKEMNCVWEEVPWETNWGRLYLNCE